MSKTHLLAGPNNSGKSNVLRVAKEVLPAFRDNTRYTRDLVDRPLGDKAEDGFLLGVLMKVSPEDLREAIDGNQSISLDRVLSLFAGSSFGSREDDLVLFAYESEGTNRGWAPSAKQVKDFSNAGEKAGRTIRELSRILTGQWGGGEESARVLAKLAEKLGVRNQIPDIASIGAFRQIRAGGPEGVLEDEHDGPGLIERLADLQNPGYNEDDKRRRFARINRFVQTLLDDDDALLEVPYGDESIIVQHEGRRLPLENYGTGLHEVIILAAAATVLSNTLVCIEEPEIHLHPTLQRKLLRYLNSKTDNQYLIATHSAHMLDFAAASISAVRLHEGQSDLSPAIEPGEVAAISFELGARASDLVQANSVIWVEGPSDKVYVRRWIAALDPDMIEGIHFSIVHYGGRLLNHLSADDEAVDELIRLPRINRHFAVVIDSDRRKPRQHLNKTKKRIRTEIEAVHGSMAWITKGYTVENYVPATLLASAVAAVHPGADLLWSDDPFENPLAPENLRSGPTQVDKIAVAKFAAARMSNPSEWQLDLKDRVRDLIKMIRAANS